MDPPKRKKHANFILFFIASRHCNISGTNGPTKMVHLSNFQDFMRNTVKKLFKCLTQKIKILIRANSKNKILILDVYFILPSPQLLQKGSRQGLSNERSSNQGLTLSTFQVNRGLIKVNRTSNLKWIKKKINS